MATTSKIASESTPAYTATKLLTTTTTQTATTVTSSSTSIKTTYTTTQLQITTPYTTDDTYCIAPTNFSTFLFAYSNDLDSVSDLWFRFTFDTFSYSYFSSFGTVRFDTESMDIEFHSDINDVTTTINKNYPNPNLGFQNSSIGSNIFDALEKFFSNTEAPVCGSIILILLKRYPNEADVSQIVSLIRSHHAIVHVMTSATPSGGSQPTAMYSVASKTNGIAAFEYDMSNAIKLFPLYGILYPVYATNIQVFGSGTQTLPDFFLANQSVSDQYWIAITFQDHAKCQCSWMSLNEHNIDSIADSPFFANISQNLVYEPKVEIIEDCTISILCEKEGQHLMVFDSDNLPTDFEFYTVDGFCDPYRQEWNIGLPDGTIKKFGKLKAVCVEFKKPECQCPVLRLNYTNLDLMSNHPFYSNISKYFVSTPSGINDGCEVTMRCTGSNLVIMDTDSDRILDNNWYNAVCDPYQNQWNLNKESGNMPIGTAKELNIGCVEFKEYECSPTELPTLVFAFSNDIEEEIVINAKRQIDSVNKFYSKFATVKFDMEEEQPFHIYRDLSTLKNDEILPDPSKRFGTSSTGSDVFRMLRNFVNIPTPIPKCGSKFYILMKRYPNEEADEIKKMAEELRKFHINLFVVVSNAPSGGLNSRAMYDLTLQTNGLCSYDNDENFGKVYFIVLALILRPLNYAVNREVYGNRVVDLPALTRSEDLILCTSLQDHGPLNYWELDNTRFNESKLSIVYGTAACTSFSNVKEENMTLTLTYKRADDSKQILQIRGYAENV
ncbi:hypothetical protein B9Z55_027165 [Caenorhabditis nigoni]|nr:hypothetical protein B9Z55_027165 [Caenorhabditis nigoni]